MAGAFAGGAGETVTLTAGEDLSLRCSLGGASGSARQWLDPRGFAIFLNAQRGLKDQRYKLIRYSKEELSIRLSNITVHDEGVYKCFYYGTPFKSKSQTVKVLAAPSKPVVKVSQGTEKSITLSCYTQGSKPQPRISWLLDNGIELPGETQHTAEADGKRWSTRSTLTVLAYGPGSTATCIAHHEARREEDLTATFRFGSFPAPVTTPNSSPTAADVDKATAENEHAPGSEITPATAGDEERWGTWSYNIPNGTERTSNGTVPEDLHRTEASPTSDNLTVMTTATFKQDPKKESIRKEKQLLLPVLVAALLFVLLGIVSLFVRKLKKAHGAWKRENDTSEQTLESYKSRSNEDNPCPEKNKPGFSHQVTGIELLCPHTQGAGTAMHSKPGRSQELDIQVYPNQLGKDPDVGEAGK
ncbi:cytotoxic and regulatory T-cell molecule [Eudromia elegans]